MRRFSALFGMTWMVLVLGCGEGKKPDPARRDGAPPAVDGKGVKSPTLYERLGLEEGLKKVAAIALAEPEAKGLAKNLSAPRLASLLVEATSADHLTDPPPLSGAEWDTMVQVVETALLRRSISGSDRDELLGRLRQGKR